MKGIWFVISLLLLDLEAFALISLLLSWIPWARLSTRVNCILVWRRRTASWSQTVPSHRSKCLSDFNLEGGITKLHVREELRNPRIGAFEHPHPSSTTWHMKQMRRKFGQLVDNYSINEDRELGNPESRSDQDERNFLIWSYEMRECIEQSANCIHTTGEVTIDHLPRTLMFEACKFQKRSSR